MAHLFGHLIGRAPSRGPAAAGGAFEVQQQGGEKLERSISIEALRSSYLLSPESYNMLSQAYEFQDLENPLAGWVSHAIALFLHGLYVTLVGSPNPRRNVSTTFQSVMSMELVGNALLRPEEVGEDDVLAIIEQISVR